MPTTAPTLSNRSLENLAERPATDVDAWVLGSSPRVRQIARHAEKAAEVQCTVLVTGETGTGKELWAKSLHQLSPRANRPFVPVNCAALTATLAESQLFGHEKGAFTGAAGRSLGVFRAAEGGVVFLDEVGEMPLELQPKLLRVLQEGEVTPVGSSRPEKIDVQVVAATNRDLEVEVAEGRFREDLYYRLNMVELRVPALRDRAEDIPRFVEFFSERFAGKYNRPRWRPSAERIQEFCEFPWPGNLRQLSHVVEQGYVLDCEPSLPVARSTGLASSQLPCTNLDKLRSMAVRQALNATGGHKGRAAKLLGVHANTMTRLLAQLDDE
ncbi:Nitrogen assimilation regulatory protein [Botrimarina colliarenosi]|uniref:Nitrogen assimilation regulatory protein n=1 Tax=Botrimarina colliarenosi TaxID=2528001 RepID=A0A5C6A7U0_9BACT|nr:sigma-54 dependent transcriptional regulator [Botrimarina colliarenosi]TWT95358.1 Nitrogen assimilation regulatory protein [Botrimarina colliarenosi]